MASASVGSLEGAFQALELQDLYSSFDDEIGFLEHIQLQEILADSVAAGEGAGTSFREGQAPHPGSEYDGWVSPRVPWAGTSAPCPRHQAQPRSLSQAGAGPSSSRPVAPAGKQQRVLGLLDEFDLDDELLANELGLRDDVGVMCEICQELQPLGSMVELQVCQHSFCLPCLAQHSRVAVEAKRVPIQCPALGCGAPMGMVDCELFLDEASHSKALLYLAEISIADNERFFCPFKDCSILMVVDPHACAGAHEPPPARATCRGCCRDVCMACSVPWHDGATCAEYQATPEGERDPNDFKLKELAAQKEWKRCPKCHSWVERTSGCPHMTCRCKAEFCYRCGKEWVDKRPTCTCFLPAQ